MKKILGIIEQVITVLLLLHYSGGPLGVILSGGASEGDEKAVAGDNSLVLLLFLLSYGVMFCLLIIRWKKVLFVLSKDKFILALIALAAISVLWSFAPGKTLNRIIALMGTTCFGIYLATRYTMKQQLQLLAWTFGLAVLMSFAFALALPQYGIMSGKHAGAWRGIYTHKNVLGRLMSLSGIIFFLLAINAKRKSWVLWGGLSLSIVLILRSTSTSSLVSLATLLAAFVTFRTFRLRFDLMIPTLIGIALIGGGLNTWLTANADIVFNSLGKDATLTGRTELWALTWDMIWKNPWLGYGFGAFWLGLEGESAMIWRTLGWDVPNAHSGLLDLWLELGILGVCVFILGFFATSLRALLWVRLTTKPEGLWSAIYLTYLFLANQTESSLLIQNSIYWVLYVAVSFSLLYQPESETNFPKPLPKITYLSLDR